MESLFDIYPKFLSGEDFGPHISSGCSCETGDGWYPLLAGLFDQMNALSKRSGTKFVARQIKEKFGTLRVYFTCALSGDPEASVIADLLIDAAERLSGSLCEICGAPAENVSKKGWLKTVCSLHENRPSIYIEDPGVVAHLMAAPKSKIDLSSLPEEARIERFFSPQKKDCRLSLIRYRSLDDYSAARLSDIEMTEEVGWFSSYSDAREAAKNLGCDWFTSRTFPSISEIRS